MMRCRNNHCNLFVFISGIILLICGIFLLLFTEDLFDSILYEQLVLKKGNEAYNAWTGLHPAAPIYTKFYVFNYTNTDGILKGQKPIVKQLGPYSYRESRINNVLEESSDYITYNLNYDYFFNQVTSCKECDESDQVYVPSLPMAVILGKLKDLNVTKESSLKERLAFDALNLLFYEVSMTPFIKLTIKQLLWGYPDPIMEFLEKIKSILKIFHFDIPKINPIISMQRNGTVERDMIGNITIATGSNDINNVMQVIKWRGQREIPVWKTKFGRMINGSDGSHVHPKFKRTEKMYMLLVDACRSIYLDYEKDTENFGMKTFHYAVSEMIFANATVNPDNKAFCLPDKCWPAGLMTAGPCADGGAPVFMSLPHFFHGDKKLVENIVGMKPKENLHATYINVEPVTGLSLEANIQFQLNFNVPRVNLLSIAKNLYAEDNFLPVMYFHSNAGIDEKSATKLKFAIYTLHSILTGLKYSVLFSGVLLIICGLLLHGHTLMKKRSAYKEFENVESE